MPPIPNLEFTMFTSTPTTSLIDFDDHMEGLAITEWSHIRDTSSDQTAINGAYMDFLSKPQSKHLALQLITFATGVAEVLRDVQPDISFSLATLFGEEQWNRWSSHQRRRLGKLFAALVSSGSLPFAFESGHRKGQVRHYVLTLV